jgi:hypothetical protein
VLLSVVIRAICGAFVTQLLRVITKKKAVKYLSERVDFGLIRRPKVRLILGAIVLMVGMVLIL